MEIASDIPFDSVRERVQLADWGWFHPVGSLDAVGAYNRQVKATGGVLNPEVIIKLTEGRKQHLERVELLNGLKYAVIRNSKTGAEEFDATEYGGLFDCGCGTYHGTPCVTQAHVIDGTDLGDGFSLKMIVAGKSTGRPLSASYVEKVVEVAGSDSSTARHEFHYDLDGAGRNFSGRYQYNSGKESSTTWFKLLPYLKDEGEQAAHRRLAYDICILDVPTNNQTNFKFGEDGQLTELQLAGKGFLGVPGASRELLALTAELQRGVIVLTGDQLQGNLANIMTNRWLGMKTATGLTLDRQDTLSGFIANINSGSPRNPREVVKFITGQ